MYHDSNLGCEAFFCYLRTQITMDGGLFDTYDEYTNIFNSPLNTMYYDSNLGCKAVFCYLRTQITMDGGYKRCKAVFCYLRTQITMDGGYKKVLNSLLSTMYYACKRPSKTYLEDRGWLHLPYSLRDIHGMFVAKMIKPYENI